MSYKAAVITVSDKGYQHLREDASGPMLVNMLNEEGYDVTYTSIVPDEFDLIKNELVKCSDELKLDLVLTTGGTGFSPRDITPEATLSIVERETRGISELMRLESLKVTPRACLSRSAAGIRKRTLIINLPGSPKAAKENLMAVLGSLKHGLDMLASNGSADCATNPKHKEKPSIDRWLKEAKQDPNAGKIGMYLTHNGVVRETTKDLVRNNIDDNRQVKGMVFGYDQAKVDQAIQETKNLPGIYYVKAWLNEGELSANDDIMYVLIGGDIRPHVIDAMQYLVGKLKNECVFEKELY